MQLPIVTINYNGSKDTLELIDSLLEAKERFCLIIVDNASPKQDELITIEKKIENKYSSYSFDYNYYDDYILICKKIEIRENSLVLIQAKENFGFAKGTNIGIRFALSELSASDYITILNNDTIVTPFFITKIVRLIQENDLLAGMGTILYYGYDKPYIWSIGGKVDWIKGQCNHVYKNQIFGNNYPEFVCRGFISGCFTVFRKDALLKIGLLDEDYFFAGEEYQYSIDLCKIGRIAWIPASIVYHKSKLELGNGSSHNIKHLVWQYNAYMVKILFINKNKSWVFKKIWHVILLIYLDTIIRKKYLSIPEYGAEGYKLLFKTIYKNVNKTKFLSDDFLNFEYKIKSLDLSQIVE